MSSGAKSTWQQLAVRALSLVAIVVLAVFVSKLAPAPHHLAAPIVALGLLLLGGDFLSVLVERLGLPHLTGYLLAGLALGPYGFGTVDQDAIHGLSLVNALALGLIALSAGSELTFALLRSAWRSLVFSILAQVLIALPLISLGFFLLRGQISFVAGLPFAAAIGVAIVWGVLGVSRSPAATLAVITQVKPKGPLTDTTLAIIVSFDVVVLLLFALAIPVAQTLLVPDARFESAALMGIARELAATLTAGITLGLLMAAYLAFVGRAVVFFVVTVCYAVTLASQFLHYDTLLLFVVAGFVVVNTTQYGEALMENIAKGGRLVYVLFFALAGAHLDISLLKVLWPIALSLCALRITASFIAAKTSSALAHDAPALRTYGWMPLVSQAGVTIGMSLIVAEAFPTFGPQLQALVIATVAINEMVGPPLFKFALDRSGESKHE